MKKLRVAALLAGLAFLPLSIAAQAERRVVNNTEWRADVAQTAAAIRKHHPRPFRTIDEEEFQQAYDDLIEDVPTLSDKEIIVRLAGLVALVDDGHTRVGLPREHPEIGLEFGHTGTARPDHEALAFKQLPIAFELFADGVFITAASREYANSIGHRVLSIDDTPIAEALETVQTITFAENRQLEALMGVDRLTLIEALAALGISKSVDTVSIEVVDRAGKSQTLKLGALPPGPVEWVGPFDGSDSPLRLQQPDHAFWSEYVPQGNYLYAQLDEITDSTIPLAEFITGAISKADRHDAKLIIDVRQNFGGSGDLNKTLVMALIQNQELNQYDRTCVLIGRRTFSAAQMLVNDLERYTRVSFVGEPTGSRPDHFGDPKKIRLGNSGLTLRVSRLHWSSYAAFDDRSATHPDFPVQWESGDFFSGRDPALERAAALGPFGIEDLVRDALRKEDLHRAARYLLDSKRAPDTWSRDLSGMLLRLGKEFAGQRELVPSSLAYRLGLYLYPGNTALEAALDALASD